MDDTLTVVSLEPLKMVTKLHRRSMKAQGKSGHHNVPGRKQDVPGVVQSAPRKMCHMSTLLFGHLSDDCSNTSTTKCSLPVVRATFGAATTSKDTMIKIYSARCCELTSLVQCNPANPPVSSIAQFSVLATVSSSGHWGSRSCQVSS